MRHKTLLILTGIVLGIIVLVSGIYVEIVRPNQIADHYSHNLSAATQPLDSCFRQLSKTTTYKVFNNPDISLATKRKELQQASDTIKQCREQLHMFEAQASQLQPLPLASPTKKYHAANVQKERAYDVISQSKDVLEQYQTLVANLDAYLARVGDFVQYTDAINRVTDLAALTNKFPELNNQAAVLHNHAKQLRKSKQTALYGQLAANTADMFDQAADGFDFLAAGAVTTGDAQLDTGIQLIESATNTYDTTIKNSFFKLTQDSYVLQQVTELPDKTENLHAEEAHD